MPTYEYRCDACGHEFELFQQMSDAVKRKCPTCGKSKLQRLIGTGAGVIFKGGGFYETDYRSDSYKKAHEAEKKAAEPKAEGKPTGDAAASAESGKASAGEAKQSQRDSKEGSSSSRGDSGARKPSSKARSKSKSTRSTRGGT